MGFSHIIALLVLVIFLIAGLAICAVHYRTTRLGTGSDFIGDFFEDKEQQLKQLNIHISINTYMVLMAASPLAIGVIVFLFSGSGFFALVIGMLGVAVPEVIVRILAGRSQKNFEDEYAKALQQLATSLRTGMNITEAVNDVAESQFIKKDMRDRFVKLSSDLQMGVSISDAFQRFADDTASIDSQDVALVIKLQTEVGGHEAQVVSEIASNIYNRIMLRKEVSSILAEPNLEAYIFDVLPIGVMIGFGLINSDFIDIYLSSAFNMVIMVIFVLLPFVGSYFNHHSINKVKKEA